MEYAEIFNALEAGTLTDAQAVNELVYAGWSRLEAEFEVALLTGKTEGDLIDMSQKPKRGPANVIEPYGMRYFFAQFQQIGSFWIRHDTRIYLSDFAGERPLPPHWRSQPGASLCRRGVRIIVARARTPMPLPTRPQQPLVRPQ